MLEHVAALAEAERIEAKRRAELEAPAKAEKARITVEADANPDPNALTPVTVAVTLTGFPELNIDGAHPLAQEISMVAVMIGMLGVVAGIVALVLLASTTAARTGWCPPTAGTSGRSERGTTSGCGSWAPRSRSS